MPESWRHGRFCDLLFQILVHALGPNHSVGKDNFVYFNASKPKRCLAPDGFVKLDVKQELFDSWKTWLSGTPELCVEILSPSDTKEKLTLKTKLERYRELGARELLVFNSDAPKGKRLRAWDRIRHDLVERVINNEVTPCVTLRAHWVVAPTEELGVALRLARDAAGKELWLTREEDERRQKERAVREKDAALHEVERLRALLGSKQR